MCVNNHYKIDTKYFTYLYILMKKVNIHVNEAKPPVNIYAR